MSEEKQPLPERWLRGPLNELPVLLQPVAFALLQAREELQNVFIGFDDSNLWTKPLGLASAGFHLNHLKGVLDRLFTYARTESLRDEQFAFLQEEGIPKVRITHQQLLTEFSNQVDKSIEELKTIQIERLLEYRAVGRAHLPSTTMGLYTHAAEHTMRHVGQLFVTVRILNSNLLDSASDEIRTKV